MCEPRPDWSPLGVNFKILDEHPHLFLIFQKPRGSRHILEVNKAFANKLNMIKRGRFKRMLVDFYFKIILPAITYAMPIWGGSSNKDGFKSLESLHCRTARIIFNKPRDIPSVDFLSEAKWDSLYLIYKTIFK